MADAFDEDVASAPTAGTGSTNAAALNAALTGPSASTDEARQFLDEQKRLTALQARILGEQHALEISHMHFRRYSDYARFALEIAGFLVVLLVVCGLATMVWNASRDRDLVVESFSVPQDVAQTGLTGSVLAGRILDRFGRMQATTFAFTQSAGSYRADTADSVRVEIPQTGISIAELNRYLRAWLGHEGHVTGDLVRTADGGFALTTRYGSEPGTTVVAKASDLDRLTEKSAEQIFAAALPYRYIEYLVGKRRFTEASALLPGLAARGSATERAIADMAWAKVYFFTGDIPHALEKGHEAAQLDPRNGAAFAWVSAAEGNLGHEEPSYASAVAALRLFNETSVGDEAAFLQYGFTAYRDELTGDFADAVRSWTQLSESTPLVLSAESATQDALADHDIAAARRFDSMVRSKDATGRPDPHRPLAELYMHLEQGDWSGAARYGAAFNAIINTQADQKWQGLLAAPDVAYAMARAGDLARARALVAGAPADCDACMRGRGRIAALQGHTREAAQAFATVASRSPHEPFAETYWGEMLLHKGDYDSAIAKFTVAHEKGPHFADPLEMWGEALMQKNRSDLALAKFEEADKYAPNWGRLHLKWGEALLYAGRMDEATKQFAAASRLDMSLPDRAALAKRANHG